MEKVHILGIAGSLRKGSINKALLRQIAALDLEGIEVSIFDPKDIPFYNGDVEAEGDPDAVVELKTAIDNADALLLVSPEYNASIPAVMKNLVDWASRPFGEDKKKVLVNKPVGITGASPGIVGTLRMQLHLRDVLLNTNSKVLRQPQAYVRSAMQIMDDDGNFTDERTLEILTKMLHALADSARS